MNILSIFKRGRILMLQALLLVSFASCSMFDSEYIDPIELGADQSEYILEAEGGEIELKLYVSHTVDLTILGEAESDWGTLSKSRIEKDEAVTFSYESNDSFKRMVSIVLSAANSQREDTIYIKQKGVLEKSFSFPEISTVCKGAGGEEYIDVVTNMKLDEFDIDISYPEDSEKDWVEPDLSLEGSKLRIKTKQNTSETDIRNAVITFTNVDAWNEKTETKLYCLQANALEAFGTLTSFDEIKQMSSGIIKDNLYIEGIVVSNKESGNAGDTPNITSTSWDRSVSPRTVYLQTSDGSQGLKIICTTEEDNIFEFGSKAGILLKGAFLSRQSGDGPLRFTIENITWDKVPLVTAGDPNNVVKKVKTIGSLTPDDMYTYVTLESCEFPIRKGPLTPVEEGNSGIITNSYRIGKSARLVRDVKGNSLYLFTNVACPYRRAGAGAFTEGKRIPYGSGSLSGVVVHEKHTRYEFEDATNPRDYGNIGDYQIRHQSESDINFKNEFEEGFSELLVEWQYMNRVSGKLLPTRGTGEFSQTSPKYTLTAYAHRDYTALQMGTHRPETGGNGCYLPNGSNIPANEAQGGNIGKGWFVGSGNYSSAWANRYWWDTDTDRGHSWVVKFSTMGLQTDQISMQISVHNGAIYSPRDFTVEWSEHGDHSSDDWKYVMDYTVPDFAVWAATMNHQANAFKEINIPLPLDILGKSTVYVRLRASSPWSSDGYGYRNYDFRQHANDASTSKLPVCAMNYCAIRYNK